MPPKTGYPAYIYTPYLVLLATAVFPRNYSSYSWLYEHCSSVEVILRSLNLPPHLPLSGVRSGQRAQAPVVTAACADVATGAIG